MGPQYTYNSPLSVRGELPDTLRSVLALLGAYPPPPSASAHPVSIPHEPRGRFMRDPGSFEGPYRTMKWINVDLQPDFEKQRSYAKATTALIRRTVGCGSKADVVSAAGVNAQRFLLKEGVMEMPDVVRFQYCAGAFAQTAAAGGRPSSCLCTGEKPTL